MKTRKKLQIDAKRRSRATTQIKAPQVRTWTTADTLGEREVVQVDGDHQQVVHWLQIRAANVGTPSRRHLETLGLDDLIHVLRGWERSGDIHLVIMAAQQEVTAEVEVLLVRVACVLAREARPESAPDFLAFGDGIDLADLEAGQCHEEGGRQVRPEGVAIEVGTMKRVPGGVHRMTVERCPRVFPLAHHLAVERLDRHAFWADVGAPIGLTEGRDGGELFPQ